MGQEQVEAAAEKSDVIRRLKIGWNLQRSHFEGEDLTLFNFAFSRLEGSVFDGCNLSRAKLTKANLRECVFRDCEMARLEATGATMNGMTMIGCRLVHGCLDAVSAKGAVVQNTDLDNTYLRAADFSGGSFRRLGMRIQGFHSRGAVMPDFDPADVDHAHESHEMVSHLLRYEYPDDMDILEVCEMLVARIGLDCWHGAIVRIRDRKPHIIDKLEAAWRKYPTWGLWDRWELGCAMADCQTARDWLDLKDHRLYAQFPGLVDGWCRKEFAKNGW